MRRVFAICVTLLTVVTVAQFVLAAMGAFNSAPNEEAFSPHQALGYFILFAALVVTAIGAIARVPTRLVAMVALSAGLVVLQALIRAAAKGMEEASAGNSVAADVVFGLHAINALAILAILESTSRRARHLAWHVNGGSASSARRLANPSR